MPVIRNKLSTLFAGGPRQFAELRDRLMIRSENEDAIPEVISELANLNLQATKLSNVPVVIAEPEERIEDVLEKVREVGRDTPQIRNGIKEVENAREAGEEVVDAAMNTIAATREFKRQVSKMPSIADVDFVITSADYGPENLRSSITEMADISTNNLDSEKETLEDVSNRLGMKEAWEISKGENAIVAIFDTGFSEGLISESRIVSKFHSQDTDSVYASAEGHGTMTAGAAAANKNENPPMNGMAPEADVILCRITDSNGQIRSDIVSKAWDHIINIETQKPIVANHSYGTPLCSGRPRQRFCSGPDVDVIQAANADKFITSVYAAGNEAMRCGHRPSGITNAITGTNSLSNVITVGALLSNGMEAQKYSSHGRGDCAPVADPKPNVSCAIPQKTYYGVKDGWKIKDMSTGIWGSSGGTSHASPQVAGMVALLQSANMEVNGEPLQTEEVKQIIEDTAEPPRPTQVNKIGFLTTQSGWDARFGHGQIKIAEALREVTS